MQFTPDPQSSTQKVFIDTMIKLGNRYKNFVILDANVGSPLGSQSFAKVFPDRLFHFGNAGQALTAAATGFAIRGKIPFICSYAVPATGRAWESIRNFLCYSNLNVKIIGINAGLLNGDEGAIYQSLEDIAIMRSIPNMKVVCPADAVEARKALEVMMLDYGPTYLRLFHLPLPDLFGDDYQFVFGKSQIYKPGSDICIFATGTVMHTSLEAAELLERKGLSTMVVNVSSLAPVDEGLITECAKAVRHVVTVEDHQITGGLGSAVAEVLTTHYPVKVLRLGMDGFGESGKVDDLYRKYRLDSAGISEQILEVIEAR